MVEYRVVSVENLGKKKYKITLEGTKTVVLSLYPQEVRRYGMAEGAVISEEDYNEVCNILYKRGKERALYYLKTADKTSSQMRKKLEEGYYPKKIIDCVINFLETYGYIDDYRYAQNYISYNKHRKSVRRMREDLCIKGIERSILDEVFASAIEESASAEEEQIELYCRKKIKNNMDDKECNKIVMGLMRKGFKYEQVRSIFKRVLEETTT